MPQLPSPSPDDPPPQSYNSTAEYSSTARSLAFVSPPLSPKPQPMRPAGGWPRSNSSSSHAALWSRGRGGSSSGNVPYHRRVLRQTDRYLKRLLHVYEQLTPAQKWALSITGLISIVLGILGLVYSERIFKWLTPISDKWRDMPGGWAILWVATFLTAFPPMFGYSTCVTLAGFVFGIKGWWIIATANVTGSLCSFLLFRHLLSGFATRLAARDPRFTAIGLVIEHDGLFMLMLIRLTPLPYSLSNGALSTIRTIKPWAFAVATATATPKLLIHVFIGTRLKQLAGGKLDASTKAINWASIIFGIVLGAVTGVVIYRRTVARARVLEAEERRKAEAEGRGTMRNPDDFEEEEEALDVGEDIIDFVYADNADEGNQSAPRRERYADDVGDEDEEIGVVDGEGGIRLTETNKHQF